MTRPDVVGGQGTVPAPVWSVAGPVTVLRHGDSLFRVYSSPLPIHDASVQRVSVTPGWLVITESADMPLRRFGRTELHLALQHAGSIVSALARVDLKRKFTASQRYVMGRNACPAKMPCLAVGCPRAAEVPTKMHYHLCMGAPESGVTVWCERHVESRQSFARPGDAFWSLHEGGGDAPESDVRSD